MIQKQVFGCHITGRAVNAYFVCKRRMWLLMHGIVMEDLTDNKYVIEGLYIHRTYYVRRGNWNISIDGGVIDFAEKKRTGEVVINEIKRGSLSEKAHIWQTKFYIYMLRQIGVHVTKGIIRYPLKLKTTEFTYSDEDNKEVEDILKDICRITSSKCPEANKKSICKRCAYHDYCFA